MIENPYEVIILYLLEIDYYWQKFLQHLERECSPNLMFQILKISSDKKASYDLYLEALASIKGGVSIFFTENKFRIKLIHNKIFSGVLNRSVNDLAELCDVLIEVENRTIAFFQESFGKLPYLKTKELLDRIINEKEQQIRKLREFGA